MQARTMLAVMDHNENHNTQREQAKTASGLQRHDVVFQRQSKQWTARPVYQETTQTFRNNMMDAVIQRRLDPSVKYKDPLSHMKVPHLAAKNLGRRMSLPDTHRGSQLQTDGHPPHPPSIP
ncbi:hypothetical protein UPYG_G00041950 [Umbra pygmaea]|uniref:Uncharacterized protein n=1 Tax=Umbra pygmaea TaxID=75934 RepID=A0ABD0XQC4_UMBPY